MGMLPVAAALRVNSGGQGNVQEEVLVASCGVFLGIGSRAAHTY